MGTMGASHTTLLRKISKKCVFSHRFATEFFQSYLLTHQNVFQCFSTAREHPLALVCDPQKCMSHLGAYLLDVGRDAYTYEVGMHGGRCMHSCPASWHYLFNKEKIRGL